MEKDREKDMRKQNMHSPVTLNVSERCDDKEETAQATQSQPSPECAVCLQPSLHPVQLPCRHIFCFLCVKGVASRNRRCALCRQEIPPDFFLRPNLLQTDDPSHTVVFDEGYQWYYEGVNGWWQYDARTSLDLESHHKKGDSSCELLIAGFLYIIDFVNMVQIRHSDRTKKRRIKRDLVNMPGRKGVAGLKIGVTSSDANQNAVEYDRPSADGHETSSSSSSAVTRIPIPISQVDRSGDQSLSPPTPYNTPQTPQTPSESPPTGATTERDLSIHLERLRLHADSRPLSESSVEGSSGDDADASATMSSETVDDVLNDRDSDGRLQEIESAIYNQMDELEETQREASPVYV